MKKHFGLASTHLPSGEAGGPAEGLIAVDNGVIHDLGVCKDKTWVGWKIWCQLIMIWLKVMCPFVFQNAYFSMI